MTVNNQKPITFANSGTEYKIKNMLADGFKTGANQQEVLEKLASELGFNVNHLKSQALNKEIEDEFNTFFKEIKVHFNEYQDDGEFKVIWLDATENDLTKLDMIKKFQQYMADKYLVGVDVRFSLNIYAEAQQNNKAAKPVIEKMVDLDIEFNDEPQPVAVN